MMSKWQKYPAYKDSGIEWIGRIPKEWEVLPTKRFHKITKEINSRKICNNVLSLTLRGVVNNNINSPEGLVPKDYATYQIFEKDNLVFKLIDLENISTSRVGIVHEKGIMSSAYIRLEVGNNSFPRYAYYYFYNLYLNQVYNNLGSGVRSTLTPTDLLNIFFIKPPKQEQIKIASYLDKKTSQIDKAINQKEKLIKLLKEYRQIIINEAVTKGVDENGKVRVDNGDFKDSGIEWIGKIPRNWNVKKLKFVLTINNGQDYKKVISDEGYPVIGSGGQFAYANQYLYDGEVLLLGRKGTVDKPLYFKGKFWTVDTMFYGVSKQNNNTKFLYYSSLSIPFKFYSTSTALPSMTQFDLNNHKIAIPPKQEQEKIVKYIENQTTKIDKALHLQQNYIEKLKEYKATLIDSVVTGKVRIV